MNDHWRADPVLAQVLEYWLRRRGERALPRRRDIDPLDLPKLLPHLQLVETAGGRFRYRLVGTRIVRAFGRDHTGAYLDELYPDDRGRLAADVFRLVCDKRQPIFARSRYFTTRDVDIIANRLYLPLSEDEASVSLILGALTFKYGSELAAGQWAHARLEPASQYVELVDLAASA